MKLKLCGRNDNAVPLTSRQVFGCLLANCCADDSKVPIFVQKVIQIIESKPENMKSDGIYRASGNLSQIQKIRFQV